jgi:hypothetical protein
MSELGQTRHIGALSTLAECRYGSNTDRIDASQKNFAMCQEATYAPQQTASHYSISSSVRASKTVGSL